MADFEKTFVTKAELYKTQNEMKDELNSNIRDVDSKINSLSEVVLPLAESSKQTALNTDRIANTMDEFTKEQRRTNGDFYDKLHEHDISINKLGLHSKMRIEDKKEVVKVIVASIGLVGAIVGGIFGLAPYLFG